MAENLPVGRVRALLDHQRRLFFLILYLQREVLQGRRVDIRHPWQSGPCHFQCTYMYMYAVAGPIPFHVYCMHVHWRWSSWTTLEIKKLWYSVSGLIEEHRMGSKEAQHKYRSGVESQSGSAAWLLACVVADLKTRTNKTIFWSVGIAHSEPVPRLFLIFTMGCLALWLSVAKNYVLLAIQISSQLVMVNLSCLTTSFPFQKRLVDAW